MNWLWRAQTCSQGHGVCGVHPSYDILKWPIRIVFCPTDAGLPPWIASKPSGDRNRASVMCNGGHCFSAVWIYAVVVVDGPRVEMAVAIVVKVFTGMMVK